MLKFMLPSPNPHLYTGPGGNRMVLRPPFRPIPGYSLYLRSKTTLAGLDWSADACRSGGTPPLAAHCNPSRRNPEGWNPHVLQKHPPRGYCSHLLTPITPVLALLTKGTATARPFSPRPFLMELQRSHETGSDWTPWKQTHESSRCWAA